MDENRIREWITALITAMAVLAIGMAGCEESSDQAFIRAAGSGVLAEYSAEQIRLSGLTEMTRTGRGEKPARIEIYLDMLDRFNNRIKAPGQFRFELYEYIPRSSQPLGRQVAVWPEADLFEPEDNHRYWQDFLRLYKFVVDVEFRPPPGQMYVLQANCTTPAGKRLVDTRVLQLDNQTP